MTDKCPYCGINYTDFRTGYSFADIKEMLWSGSDNPKDWKYKRRNTVLGKWRQTKQELWLMHQDICKREKEDCKKLTVSFCTSIKY